MAVGEGGNINGQYSTSGYGVVVKHDDTHIDNDCPVLNKTFAAKTFTNCLKSAKSAKVFTTERFPLYGTCIYVLKDKLPVKVPTDTFGPILP